MKNMINLNQQRELTMKVARQLKYKSKKKRNIHKLEKNKLYPQRVKRKYAVH